MSGQEEALKKYWQSGQSQISAILKMGMADYIRSVSGLESAFVLSDHSLRCIDEGTPGGIHCAGSGILLDAGTIKSDFAAAELDGIYSHAGCGAAALYAKQENLDIKNADEYGIEWAKALAQNLGLPYNGHIDAEIMARPAAFHIAKVVYYDGTGRFDPSKCAGLPAGFVISRKYLNPDYAAKEVKVAVDIALGHHGFGSYFSPNIPFLLLAVADSGDADLTLDKLKSELLAAAKSAGDRVMADGFETRM